MLKRLVIALSILIATTMPTGTKAEEKGAEAWKRGDYATAFQYWLPLAESGDAKFQSNVGSLYYRGLGVPQDFAKALHWYQKAAAQGDAPSQYKIGLMFSNGEGVPQDHRAAATWYLKAAEQGRSPAQYNLGLAYARGEGVPQDLIQSYVWLDLAAAGYQDTVDEGGDFYGYRDDALGARDEIAKFMTTAQIEEAQSLAREQRARMK